MSNETLWHTKLAARLHDPAEKALVLLRDPAGHEGGSTMEVGKELGFPTHLAQRRDGSAVEKLTLPDEIERIVKQADHWAAAADRAQFPKDTNERFVEWAQVRFADEGELVHPLSGERYEIRNIGQQVLTEHIKAVSGDHFKRLIHNKPDGSPDYRLTALAFWRFGPELGKELRGIGHLWNLLPADTRTPDHTIWQHLDLTSALAGAMATGSRPALLTLSIGPVQDFIAAARSTSDLWAGSHFLSTLAWQAMKEVATAYGPDAILFPQLRAVPVVDLWLIEEGVRGALFEKADWNDTNTDYNPLFVAALPNKFVAIVPEGEAASLAHQIREHLRRWVQDEARAMLDRLLKEKEIGEQPRGQHCYRQLEEQLRDFPEVHWAIVPWLNAGQAQSHLQTFCPIDEQPPFFTSQAWTILKNPIEPEQGWRFWEPNDGMLYPAVHELGERTLASAKSARPFSQLIQHGYRDSLTGEYEWLTLDQRQLTERSPRKRTDTLWAKVSIAKPSWAKKGEHLSAFGLIKRLWPERFIDWIKNSRWSNDLARKPDLSRYVISTHVMALAPSLERLMTDGPAHLRIDDPTEREKARRAYAQLEEQTRSFERPPLPRRLMRKELRERDWWEVATRLPTLIEQERERVEDEQEEASIARVMNQIETAIGQPAERYYSLLLMDGDRLGAWLSGKSALTYEQVFHSKVAAGLRSYNHPDLQRYLVASRPTSPARHMAISSALNGFALDLVRYVVEEESLGKVLYAGGDDVMAMVCVRDLLNAMALLRLAYSGGVPDEQPMPSISTADMKLKRGFVQLRNRLYQAMGTKATASCGAVIAHHQAPLAMVLRELRAAEQRAKKEGGRDAFSITVMKRSGGVLTLTAKWGEPLAVLLALRDFLADPAVSRRAVYNSLVWLQDLPRDASDEMLGRLLGYQFKRQTAGDTAWNNHDGWNLCQRIAVLACRDNNRLDWLFRFMGVAEFLAREARIEIQKP